LQKHAQLDMTESYESFSKQLNVRAWERTDWIRKGNPEQRFMNWQRTWVTWLQIPSCVWPWPFSISRLDLLTRESAW